jgi:guanylate kinase
MSNKGSVIILSAASGSGKTSLAGRVLAEVSGLKFSVSHTTRKPRRGERHGVDYFFISEAEFGSMAESGAFLEYALVHGNYYGTARDFVLGTTEAGNDILLDIDVQGALEVKRQLPEAVSVFVLAPSFAALRERLAGRASDDENVIAARLKIAKDEIRCYEKYDYLIINDNIEESVFELKSIIYAARCRTARRKEGASRILKSFLSETVDG